MKEPHGKFALNSAGIFLLASLISWTIFYFTGNGKVEEQSFYFGIITLVFSVALALMAWLTENNTWFTKTIASVYIIFLGFVSYSSFGYVTELFYARPQTSFYQFAVGLMILSLACIMVLSAIMLVSSDSKKSELKYISYNH